MADAIRFIKENNEKDINNIIPLKPVKEKGKAIKPKGMSSEVYPFKTKEEIQAMLDVLDKAIENAATPTNKQIAHRNKLLFIIGINLGLRISDLRMLTWGDFLEYNDGVKFRESKRKQPKKTANQSKFVTLFFNSNVKKAIAEYLAIYPFSSMKEYIFFSRKQGEPMSEIALGKIIKDTAKEAGIRQNINSHSLRKTFGYMIYQNAKDKADALVKLQKLFNHASTQTTLKYIGLLSEDLEELFESLAEEVEFDLGDL